jgi:Ca2+/Na+ antiporter
LEDKDTPIPTFNDWRNIFTPAGTLRRQIGETKRDALIIFGGLFYLVFFTFDTNYEYENVVILYIIFLLVTVIFFAPLAYIKLKRKLKNPLYGLLEPPKTSNAPTAKWWRLDWWFRWFKR